jgi:uncharacterized protein
MKPRTGYFGCGHAPALCLGLLGALLVVLCGVLACCRTRTSVQAPSARGAPATGATAEGESFSQAQIPLIFPGMNTQGTTAAQYRPPVGAQRLELRASGGQRIEAIFCPASAGPGADIAHQPTVLYFYGNAQCLAFALEQVDLLQRCGANVLIADYLGYGLSEGKPSEAGCYAVATALHGHAMSRKDIDRNKLVAAGWSLGAAVAIDLAAREKLAGLITLSAYTSKRDLARRQFPTISPTLIEHPFLSRDKIRTITCPTLIIHGRDDTLVPFTMSAELRDAAAGRPLTYVPIEGAGHNDLFLIGGERIEASITAFFGQLGGPGAATGQRPEKRP